MQAPRSAHTLVVLVGYLLGALALARGLPADGPFTWTSADGRARGLGAIMAAFLLPTALLLIDRLLRGLALRHPVDRSTGIEVLAVHDAIMLRFCAFIVGVHAVVLLALLGTLQQLRWGGVIVPVMLGLTMIGIGNLLPKTRPNLAIGIRTRRTLADRAAWNRTHRIAGYIIVASGVVVVVSAIAVPPKVGPAMILAVGPIALLVTCALVRRSGARAHV